MLARCMETRSSRTLPSPRQPVGIVMRVLPGRSAFVLGYEDGSLAYFNVREPHDMPALGDRISCASAREPNDATNHSQAGRLIGVLTAILRLPPIAALALAE